MSEDELLPQSMRESLFRHIIENCGDNQIIIAENELPQNVDYSQVNLIEFTKDEKRGRFGFMRSVNN